MSETPDRGEKSTTVRLRPLPAPALLRAAFRIAARISPRLAATAARRLFFLPPRSPLRPEQRAVLGDGRRFEAATAEGRVVGWTWGRGEPVLLLHGWGGHAGQLTPFVAPLLERGLQPVALDLPGHGGSPGRQASIRHFAVAVLEASAPFGPLAGVVAHSFGAAAATLAFERGLAARAAVFLAPPSRFETFFARVAQGLGLDGAVRRRLENEAEAWVGLRFAEVEPRWLAPRQRLPLLVLHDRADDEVLHLEGEELARLWPGALLRSTTGLGHYRILRDPAIVAESVAFLDGARAALELRAG